MSGRIIVIGAGHNGLTAAALLAKAGREVVVLEARDTIGGLAGRESFGEHYAVPGVLHDTRGVRQTVIEELELEKHGLKRAATSDTIYAPSINSEAITIRDDALGGAISDEEQARYTEYRRLIERVRPVFAELMNRPAPAPRGGMWPLVKTAVSVRLLGSQDMTELIRVSTMCVADWMRDSFGDERLRAALALPAVEASFAGPWSAGTALNLLLQEATAAGEIVGGPAALTAALKAATESQGVAIRCGAAVSAIRVEQGKVRGIQLEDGESIDAGVVLASCDPKETFLKLIGAHRLPPQLANDIDKVRARGTTAKLHLGLSGPLELADGTEVTRLRTGETLDDIERAYDAVKYRQYANKPVLDVRAWPGDEFDFGPEGHHVVSALVHFASFDLEGGWNEEQSAALGQAAIDELAVYCPSVLGRIEAQEVLTPADLAQRYRLPQGHLLHGEHAADQLLFMRPSVDCSNYRTPIAGLYLCGSGCHPSGGVTAAPGWLAAQAVKH